MLVESYGFGCALWSCSRILLCFSHGVICKPLRKDRPTLHPLFGGNHSSSGSHAISAPFAPLRCDKLSQERWKPRLSKFKKKKCFQCACNFELYNAQFQEMHHACLVILVIVIITSIDKYPRLCRLLQPPLSVATSSHLQTRRQRPFHLQRMQ